MPFAVVLDTCVLYPAHLRDTLLRHAERGLYRALWSADILGESERNLVEDGIGVGPVRRLIVEMGSAFPDAEVSGYRSSIDVLTCDPKERHVLAAAVRADAAAIVTFNIDDFPPASVDPFEIGLLLSGTEARLTPLYDLATATMLDEFNWHTWEPAMSIHGEGRLECLTGRHWHRFAATVGIAYDLIGEAAHRDADGLLTGGRRLGTAGSPASAGCGRAVSRTGW